ncbi:MAG: hypothetical protein OXB84_05650 [Halobacteriovoraceae bacterium]|nr:hypothetical protein [Halobacteriovoraceae bacterium]
MDAFLGIFSKLGVDYTIFIQLIIFIGIYFALKEVLFDRLLEVLRFREDKTEILQKKAEEKQIKADKLAGEYREKINAVHSEIQKQWEQEEKEMESSQRDVWKKEEDSLNRKIEVRRQELESWMKKNKEAVKIQIDPLAKKLLDKLVH